MLFKLLGSANHLSSAHSSYTGTPVRPEIDTLISSLFQLAQRWSGAGQDEEKVSENLASRFAMRLMRTRDGSAQSPLDIQKPAYSDEQVEIEGTVNTPPTVNKASYPDRAWYSISSASPESLSLAFPPLPPSFQQQQQQQQQQCQQWDQQATANGSVVCSYEIAALPSAGTAQFAPMDAYEGSSTAANIPTQQMDVNCRAPLNVTGDQDLSLDKISAIFTDPEFYTLDRVLMYAGESSDMQ